MSAAVVGMHVDGMADGEAQTAASCSFPAECLNLRSRGHLPQGRCVYIQSGDPGDFDGMCQVSGTRTELRAWCCEVDRCPLPCHAGYLIAIAGAELELRTEDLQFALVVSKEASSWHAPGTLSCMATVHACYTLHCPCGAPSPPGVHGADACTHKALHGLEHASAAGCNSTSHPAQFTPCPTHPWYCLSHTWYCLHSLLACHSHRTCLAGA